MNIPQSQLRKSALAPIFRSITASDYEFAVVAQAKSLQEEQNQLNVLSLVLKDAASAASVVTEFFCRCRIRFINRPFFGTAEYNRN